MKLKKGSVKAITAKLESLIAMDGDITPDVVEGVIKTVADSILPQSPDAVDSDVEEVAEDEEEVTKADEAKAEDEEEATAEDSEPEKQAPAMDADAIQAAAVKQVTALFEAREAVKPLVGVVAMDSAEAVYGFALKQKGVDTTGVHPSAYKAMANMLLQSQTKSAPIAMDSAIAPADELTARFG